MSPASLGVLCFRRRIEGEADEDRIERMNSQLVRSLARTSTGFVSSTKLRGRFAIRLCVFNHTTRKEDVEAVLDHFERSQVEDVAAAPVIEHDRDARLDDGWLGAPRVDPATISGLPLFAALGARDLERVSRMAREVRIPAGAAIVEQWDVGREFYVIADGTARVFKDGKPIDDMGRGDFSVSSPRSSGARASPIRASRPFSRRPMSVLSSYPVRSSTSSFATRPASARPSAARSAHAFPRCDATHETARLRLARPRDRFGGARTRGSRAHCGEELGAAQ